MNSAATASPDAVIDTDESNGEDAVDEHAVFTPDEIVWEPGPEVLPDGAEVAVLDGDPAASDYFALRLKLPDGYIIPPHTHPATERVTVISGTFYIGHGEEIANDMTQLDTGSYIMIPPENPHHARAEGETIIQLSTVGPWALNYINPEDDPRNE
ncbi:cupin domain-containing protein [Hoyosella subflava]|uniref:Cupin 2 conserved barrel domain protein n=1 Tax=Hoyosella subflava (strain DSM 45089 / JCM 17490 / NBRC 109087 / DQS3-9A1) TaxID=443218 RepID=F6EPU3_HOYSD|nr:cupin domain-containing protein [Hoyosella subflava]AEF40572.1 Cupin 2 conserved barrel domain protein [Hoyosella subflava DQS3-9A1]